MSINKGITPDNQRRNQLAFFQDVFFKLLKFIISQRRNLGLELRVDFQVDHTHTPFPDSILLELRLGFAFGVCLQRGKHCCLIELVTEMFRSDKLRSASGQIAKLSTAFLDGNAVLLHELR